MIADVLLFPMMYNIWGSAWSRDDLFCLVCRSVIVVHNIKSWKGLRLMCWASLFLIPWYLEPIFGCKCVLLWETLQPSVASCPPAQNKLTRKLCLQVDNGTLNNEFTLTIQLLLGFDDDNDTFPFKSSNFSIYIFQHILYNYDSFVDGSLNYGFVVIPWSLSQCPIFKFKWCCTRAIGVKD